MKLSAGDCVFMPAFYYYQMIGFTAMEDNSYLMGHKEFLDGTAWPGMYNDLRANDKVKSEQYSKEYMTTVVALKFEGNSEILNGFMEAVEQNLI